MKELAFGDQRARRVDTRPVVREGLNDFFMLVSLVVRAAVRWVMVGGWFWGLSGVCVRISVSRG